MPYSMFRSKFEYKSPLKNVTKYQETPELWMYTLEVLEPGLVDITEEVEEE
jgi:hypothetical protein